MRIPADLHPDDTAARTALLNELRALRPASGISQRQLADRLGVHKSRAAQLDQGQVRQVCAIQRWARAFDRRLTLDVCGLVVPDDGDALAAMYAAQNPADPVDQDRLALRVVVNDLARVRRSRMFAWQFGELLGVTECAVLWREEHPDGAHLVLVQQTARALGGRLLVGLAPVGVSHAVV